MELVFVYGTLRRGGVREMPGIFPDAKFVGRASVGGSLYDFGPYPGILLDEANTSVVGELYEVSEDTLKRLDEIEEPAHYVRHRVEVSLGKQSVTCWIYEPALEFYPRRSLIASGDWIEYAKTKREWPEDV